MNQKSIPYWFMRGGTSRGPYFKRDDLPNDLESLSEILVATVGAGHPLNIDGVGGGNAVTTKVAMLSKSDDEWADVDYFFAQVAVLEALVDYKPTCGNILSGVGPAALEMGLVTATGDETVINIRAVNTGARVQAKVKTPQGQLTYAGDAAIAGVPGTAAPIELTFLDVAGSAIGAMLPTGNARDVIDGIEVTCMDVAMPVVMARAEDLGITGYESAEELDADTEFFARMESLRLKAGELMGMGDVTKSVTPKFAVLAKPRNGGTITARYFMPWKTHPTMAVTGAQCIASCALQPGSVADGLCDRPDPGTVEVVLEHPGGQIEVLVSFTAENDFTFESAGLIRTARKLADGQLYIPS